MDGLEEKIKMVADMLGVKNIPDNVVEIISSLTEKKEDTDNPPTVSSSIGQVSDSRHILPSSQEQRICLLKALKPYLSTHRKTKLDKCIKYLAASELLKSMNLFDK